MASAWGSAWASAWGSSWGSTAGATEVDHHDGGYEWESGDEIRRRVKRVEEASELSAKQRRQAEKRLTDELDRAYRKVVLNEPEIAAEVAAAVSLMPVEIIDLPPTLDWRGMTDLIGAAQSIIAILERDRMAEQAMLADEEDVELLLMAI